MYEIQVVSRYPHINIFCISPLIRWNSIIFRSVRKLFLIKQNQDYVWSFRNHSGPLFETQVPLLWNTSWWNHSLPANCSCWRSVLIITSVLQQLNHLQPAIPAWQRIQFNINNTLDEWSRQTTVVEQPWFRSYRYFFCTVTRNPSTEQSHRNTRKNNHECQVHRV